MSFAFDVKTELCKTNIQRKCCALAEAYGILLYCNTFRPSEVRIVTEHDALSRRLPILFKKAFRVTFDKIPDTEGRSFQILEEKKLATIVSSFGAERTALAHHINFAMVEEDCCRTAFLRGVFLAGGSVTDPKKGYHLEMVTPHYNVSRELIALMGEAGFQPKEVVRKANYIAYFKKSGFIEDFLTAIGAPISAMEIMNTKLEKNLRGSVNRRVNCDSANLDKVVEAAQLQIESIRILARYGLMDGQPDKLKETAILRMEHPAYTLSQLALEHTPPLTKSALNHRLRKLIEQGKQAEERAVKYHSS